MREGLRIVAFVLLILAFFVWAGRAVTDVSGEGEGGPMVSGDVSVEAGRVLFWGAGKCSTCHAFGSEGSAIRCPDLGAGPGQDAPIGVRADQRVEGQDAIAYLVESLYEPDVHVVEGYPAGLMNAVDRPPTSLSDDQITSLVLYLVGNSGLAVPDAAEVVRAQRPWAGRDAGEAVAGPALDLPRGDPLVGREVYLVDAKCWSCHAIEGLALPELEAREDAIDGPDLTSIGAIQTRDYLLESLIDPDAVVVADPVGVEPGSKRSYRTEDGSSRMPGFLDALTFQQILDLAAYLETLTGPESVR